jgi:hypothetical protein
MMAPVTLQQFSALNFAVGFIAAPWADKAIGPAHFK